MQHDPRVHERIGRWDGRSSDAVIVGVPFDHGVLLNGGRPGAARGPEAFRRALERFGTTYDLDRSLSFDSLRLADAGDAKVVAEDVAATHDAVSKLVSRVIAAGAVPMVIGGGNDATFATVRSLLGAGLRVGGINVDAHFDVREVVDGRITSGTPFRRIIQELGVDGGDFVELGAHAHVNSKAHHEWLLERGARVVPLTALRAEGVKTTTSRELSALCSRCASVFVSIDLDVFAAAYAPGVSAPGTEGLTPEEGRELAFAAGGSERVALFELMELNPVHDVDDRTARLAAMLACSFLAGLATRR